MNKKPSILPIAFAVVVLSLAPGWAAADQSVVQLLERRHGEVMRALQERASTPAAAQQQSAKLDDLLGRLLNYDELARRALRDHWPTLTTPQREEFVSLLQGLVQRSYRKNMQSSLDFAVTYVNYTGGPEDVTVHTVARSRKNRRAPDVSIDYALARSGTEWRVYDVVTDGVSMVGNYRSQFNRIIRKDGWAALLGKMRDRLADGTDL